nr:hypothetical protein [Tanacetum cinerariifolium]
MQTDEPTHFGTTIVEVPKELPKVSMLNSCLKKLKFHLASFDIVVKEQTTATTITEGTWGFEHTKSCFRDDIIPFVKNLKELFTSFDQCLIDECVARYALSRNSNVKRALFTTPVAAKSKNLGATSVVAKSRLSVAKTPKATNKEKVLVITALKEQLKGKAVLPKAVSLNPIDPALLQADSRVVDDPSTNLS